MKNFDLVFDIETKNPKKGDFWTGTEGLEVSVVCAYRSDTNEFLTFWEKDLNALEDLFSKAYRVIGFNSWNFDEPVLQKYFKLDISTLRSIDMLEAVRKSLGTRIKLDVLAKATLGKGKIASGLDAITFWEEGRLDKLEEYCRDDVKVTRDIYWKGRDSGKISYINGLDEVVEFNVNWADGERLPVDTGLAQQSLF